MGSIIQWIQTNISNQQILAQKKKREQKMYDETKNENLMTMSSSEKNGLYIWSPHKKKTYNLYLNS